MNAADRPPAPATWHPVSVGTWNTHVSHALRQGGLEWLLEHAPGVKLWCLQEVESPRDVTDALRRARVLGDWELAPARGYSRRGGMPYVLAHRSRFRVLSQRHRALRPANYPRALLDVLLEDIRAQRMWGVSSVHVDPLGRGFVRANRMARKWHERQVQANATLAASRPGDWVSVAAGDWNEHLGQLGAIKGPLARRHALARMAAAGLAPSYRQVHPPGRVDLDDVFLRMDPFVRVHWRRMLTPPQRGNDHNAVIVRLQVRNP